MRPKQIRSIIVALLLAACSIAAVDAQVNEPAFTVRTGTQVNIDRLGIGVGYVGGGTYLDDNQTRREGLHASLSIAVRDEPKLFQQPDVHEGEAIVVAGYRIVVIKLDPGPRGDVVLRVEKAP